MSTLIEKYLSKQYDKNIKIEIFDTYQIFDTYGNFNYKIVDFTLVGSEKCGFAVIQEDENLRYKLISVVRPEKMLERAFDIHIEHVYLNDKKHDLRADYFIVLSMDDELSKIKMTIDNGKPIYKEINSSPSLTVIEIPFGSSHLEYLFYDKSGNHIR